MLPPSSSQLRRRRRRRRRPRVAWSTLLMTMMMIATILPPPLPWNSIPSTTTGVEGLAVVPRVMVVVGHQQRTAAAAAAAARLSRIHNNGNSHSILSRGCFPRCRRPRRRRPLLLFAASDGGDDPSSPTSDGAGPSTATTTTASTTTTTTPPPQPSKQQPQQQQQQQQPPAAKKKKRPSPVSSLPPSSASQTDNKRKQPSRKTNSSNQQMHSSSSSSSSVHRNNPKGNRPQQQSQRGRNSSGNLRSPPSDPSRREFRELNRRLAGADSHRAVLEILQREAALAEPRAGGALNAVNFSTALHRLARHCATAASGGGAGGGSFQQRRAAVLGDARAALLLACAAEAVVASDDSDSNSSSDLRFGGRDFANAAWALAKLKLPPPAGAVPLAAGRAAARELLGESAQDVREAVLQVARERQRAAAAGSSSAAAPAAPAWIPALSRLAGHWLDYIAWWTVGPAATGSRSSSSSSSLNPQQQPFQLQEYANLLWALATAGRADGAVFGAVTERMVEQQRRKLAQSSQPQQSSSRQSNKQQQQPPLRPQEWSNTLWAYATAQCYNDQYQALLEFVAYELLDDNDGFIDEFKSQEIANTVWAVATLLANKRNSNASSSSSSAVALEDGEQEAALTILRHAAGSVVRRLQQRKPQEQPQQYPVFRTQEISNTAWAFATLGFGLAAAPNGSRAAAAGQRNNYVVLASRDAEADAALARDAVDALVRAALPLLPRFASQELNNLSWALARLLSGSSNNGNNGIESESQLGKHLQALLQGIGAQLADRRRAVMPQDIGTSLWGMATLGFFDMDAYRGMAARITPDQGHRCKPQELSNTVWAFATADAELGDRDCFDTSLVPSAAQRPPRDPATVAFAVAAQELMRRPHQFKAQEIKDVLWSFSKVGIRHPALFRAVAEHLVGATTPDAENGDDGRVSSRAAATLPARGMEEFSSQGLGNLAWAYARQAQLSEEVRDRIGTGSYNGRLLIYRTSYFDIGERLLHKLFGAIGDASVLVHEEMLMGKPQDLANTAWAFATLGLKHADFMEAAVATLDDRLERYVRGERTALTTFKGQELANVLWSLSTLNFSYSDFLKSLAAYLRVSCEDSNGKITTASIARTFNRQEIANMAWSCAVYGKYPEDLMTILYKGLTGWGEDQDPSHLSRVHRDLGLQQQAITTLIYVQAALDQEGCCQHLSLPDDFPDGWAQTSSDQTTHDDHMAEVDFELNLNTSQIQRLVSAAFSRINFEFVEEHTITMKDMAEDYGIRLPPKKKEILSIDIANLEEKIAIEVDGPAHFISRIEDVDSSRQMGYTKVVNGNREYQFRWTGEQQEMNGATALKHRLLTGFGWKVIHLPFWEWYALGGDPVREEEYCRHLLEKARSE